MAPLPFNLPALEAPAPQPALPPRDARALTLLLVGRIIGTHGDGLCRIRNISASGLMAEVCASFAIGEMVGIELRNGWMLAGEVRWTKAGTIGLRFERPITDIKRFLAEQRSGLRKPDGRISRSPRLPTDCSADVQIDGLHYHGAVTDLSQHGARLVTSAPLVRDGLMALTMAGLPQLRGVARWLAEDGAGITFLDPLAFAMLAEWLDDPALRYNRKVSPTRSS